MSQEQLPPLPKDWWWNLGGGASHGHAWVQLDYDDNDKLRVGGAATGDALDARATVVVPLSVIVAVLRRAGWHVKEPKGDAPMNPVQEL